MGRAKKTTGVTKQGFVPDFLFRFPGVFLLVVPVVLIAYFPMLSASLGKLDEYNILVVNLDFLRDFANLKEAFLLNPFFSKGGDFYRPLQNVSFMIDAHLSGDAGWGYYLTNILIHAGVAGALLVMMKLLGVRRQIALGLTLLYAVHPLFVQTVAWAPSRGDMLIALFGVISFTSFIWYARSRKSLFLVLHLAAYALALLSKESAVVIPVLAYGWVLWFEKEHPLPRIAWFLPPLFYALIVAGFFYLRNVVVGISVPENQVGLEAILHNLRTLPELFIRLFVPVGLGPMPAFHPVYTLAGIFLPLALLFLIWRYQRAHLNIFLFGLAWFILLIAPALIYVNKYGSASCDYMEHRAYLPAIGMFLFLGIWISKQENRRTVSRILIGLAGLILVFGIYTRVYTSNYVTTEAYYGYAVETNPASAVAVYCRGTVWMYEQGNYTGALKDFDRALELFPDYPQAFLNKGYCFEQLGDPSEAERCYLRAARLQPAAYEPRFALALLYNKAGLRPRALSEYDTVLILRPGFAEGWFQRGMLHLSLGDYPLAVRDLERAAELQPNSAETRMFQGVARFQTGAYREALDAFNQAISLRNDYADAYLNRGILLFQVQEVPAALNDLSESIRLDGNNEAAWLNRGRIYFFMKEYEKARSDWETASRLGSPEAATLLREYLNLSGSK